MGIEQGVLEAIIREKAYRDYAGTVLTLGRQTIGTTMDETRRVFEVAGVKPAPTRGEWLDKLTLEARRSGGKTIRDTQFFEMLGLRDIKAIDVSDYEGAELIADLNRPVAPKLENICDLLIDGSTLDNIFDPATGLRNIARMMRPGGRCFLINMANYSPGFAGIPYTMFNPLWFFDYFVANEFAYCQTYMVVYGERRSVYVLSYDHASRRWDAGPAQTPSIISPIRSEHHMAIVVFAEKAANSTWDRLPTQHAYRAEPEWRTYEETVRRFAASDRPYLVRSGPDGPEEADVPVGWIRVQDDGSERLIL